ncbi:MAG TPA: DUF4157 domain-containing protein, partial [Telluria sp.]|nr:DUF4157 domain-containing protein [Telluria sp.]
MRTREAVNSTPRQAEAAQRKTQPTGHLQDMAQASPRVMAQRKLADAVQSSPRAGGLPAQLKAGIESLSGMSMDHVAVHYNSSRPAQLRAHAYAQGDQIHVGPGQEKHLPHEAWHVVQQAQGRVRPTLQMHGGVPLNDHAHLEREADAMGAKAMQMKGGDGGPLKQIGASGNAPVQRYHMQDDAEGLFLAQEERDTGAGKTYLSTEHGKANLRGRKKSTIRVADTGELAIEAAPGREAKIFYGTPAIQQASNKVLKSLNSPIRLGVNGSLTLPV